MLSTNHDEMQAHFKKLQKCVIMSEASLSLDQSTAFINNLQKKVEEKVSFYTENLKLLREN